MSVDILACQQTNVVGNNATHALIFATCTHEKHEYRDILQGKDRNPGYDRVSYVKCYILYIFTCLSYLEAVT